MNKTRNILMSLFGTFLLAAALLYVCGDFLQVDLSLFGPPAKGQQLVSSTLMILLTIGLLPLMLRLFKFDRVRADLLRRQAPALLRWGSIRLIVMGLLLVVNTFLYYAFGFESTYGYLAVMVLLCMPFVVPTMSRCQAEVSADEPQTQKEEDHEEANGSHSQL